MLGRIRLLSFFVLLQTKDLQIPRSLSTNKEAKNWRSMFTSDLDGELPSTTDDARSC